MNRQEKSSRILDLLDRPKERRELGMSNLDQMEEQELDILLAQLEEDTAAMANALRDWLKPDARHRLFDNDTGNDAADDDKETPKLRASGED